MPVRGGWRSPHRAAEGRCIGDESSWGFGYRRCYPALLELVRDGTDAERDGRFSLRLRGATRRHGYSPPAVIEREAACLSGRITDAHDARLCAPGPLNDVEPSICAFALGKFELRPRYRDRAVVQGSAHRLHLAPSARRCPGCGLDKVVARVVRRRALPIRFLFQDERDGGFLERHARCLLQAIRVVCRFIVLDSDKGDKSATIGLGRRFGGRILLSGRPRFA
jgi:hypothetical protein